MIIFPRDLHALFVGLFGSTRNSVARAEVQFSWNEKNFPDGTNVGSLEWPGRTYRSSWEANICPTSCFYMAFGNIEKAWKARVPFQYVHYCRSLVATKHSYACRWSLLIVKVDAKSEIDEEKLQVQI